MKKLWLFFCFFFAFSLLYAGSFTTDISTEEVTLEKLNGSAHFTGAALTTIPGYPALPVTEINFLLPDEADLSTVTAYIEEDYQETVYSEEWDVKPAPPDLCGEDMTPCWPSSVNIIDGRDTDIYSKNSYINGKYVDTVTTGKTSGYKLVRVKVLLFDYNPVAGRLKKLENARLTVTFSGGDNEITIPSKLSPNKLQALSNLPEKIVNYDEIEFINNNVAFSAIAGNDQNKYYIITTDTIYSSSGQMKRFIASKMARGFEVHLVTEEYSVISNALTLETGWAGEVGLTGYEAAEKIRNYLVSRQNKIDYLLLIGDPHPGECTGQDADGDYLPGYKCHDGGDIPMKWISSKALSTSVAGEPCSTDKAEPSDFYYADLSSDWDHDKDKLVGNDVTVYCYDSSATSAENCNDWRTEKLDGAIERISDSKYIDRTAEVIVGRIPVYNNNIDNLDSILLKTIAYENSTKENAAWRKKIFLPMYPINSSTPAWEFGEAIVNEILPNDFEKYRIYISELYNDKEQLYNNIGNCEDLNGISGTHYREVEAVNDECYYTSSDYKGTNIKYKSCGNSQYQKYICNKNGKWTVSGDCTTVNNASDLSLIADCAEGEKRYIYCYNTTDSLNEHEKFQLQQCQSDGTWDDKGDCTNFSDISEVYAFCGLDDNGTEKFKLYEYNSEEGWKGVKESECLAERDSSIPYVAPSHCDPNYRFDLLSPEEEADTDPLFFGSTPVTPSIENVKKILNDSKQFGIVTWCTHGNATGAAEIIDNNIALEKNSGGFANLDNEHPFFTVQASCENARPENDKNLAYSLLLNGAIGTIAATRDSAGGSSSFNRQNESFINDTIRNKNSGANPSLAYFFTRELTGTSDKEPQDAGHALFNTKEDALHFTNNNLYNLYGDPSLSINTYYDGRDSDGDGIRDSFDNCPNVKNQEQADWNYNNIGNACEDSDKDGFLDIDDNCPAIPSLDLSDSDDDGVGDLCDNCPFTPNSDQINSDTDEIGDACDNCPLVYNPYEEASLADELISGECRVDHDSNGICTGNFDGGARFNPNTYKHGYFVNNGNFPFFSLDKKYMWQPDHDLDGIGDKCDPDYKYVKNNQSPVNQFKEVTECKTTSSMEICWGDFYINQYIEINNATTISKESEPTEIDNRFCWVDDEKLNDWGKLGFCTNKYPDNPDNPDNPYTFIPFFAQNYGYSHGSDPKPADDRGNEIWKEISSKKRCTDDDNNFKYKYSNLIYESEGGETVKWDWKEDVRCKKPLIHQANIVNYKRIEGNEKPEPFFYYTTSAGYRSIYYNNNTAYLSGDSVSTLYFYSLYTTYARANRSSAGYNAIGYGIKEGLASARFFFKYLYPYPDHGFDKDSCPFCGPGDRISRDLMNIWKYSPLTDAASVETIRMEPEGTVMTIGNDLYKFSRATDNYWYMWINEETKRADWQLMAVVMAGSVQPYSATYADKAYVTDGTNLYYMGSDMIIQQSVGTNSVSAASKAVINTAKLYYAAALPTVTNPTLININESLYLLGNGSSVMELYKLSSENQFEKVSSSNAPAIRDRINYSVINGALYIAGGGNYTPGDDEVSERYGIAPKTDLWQYTEESGFNKITDSLPEEGIFNLFITATAEKAILFSKQINDEGNTLKTEVNLETGEITTTETSVEGWTSSIVYEENYCIYDTGSRIYPGILKEGECTKLSKYNYDSHTYFDYKKTVAGKSNHLYLGGLSGIREITIEEDGDLNKEKLHWLGNINKIAVKDNYLYGAGGNKIEILKIESDGSLSGKNALSTKDCDNIRIHGSYLIAGENKKVTIWDISTLENPKKVKTISVDYPVKDIETGGNYLYIYHDKLFKTGKLALYDISDILNPVKKDEEKKECNDPELTVSGGEVYMGCKNGQYKAVNSNGSLSLKKMSGEKNYMREAYYYNGVIYQVFSGKLHESK